MLREYADCPQKYEKFCDELFRKMGHKAQTTAVSNDGGYDAYHGYGKDQEGEKQ